MTGVSIFGSVAGPGIYDYVDEMRMLDLISMAHGLSEGAALRHIRVIRGSGPNQRTITVSFNKVIKDHNKDKANILMEPGDIVYVPQKALWSASALANTISPIAAVIMAGAAVALATKK
jgi:protein involved in polysaccharide export with SLBB domain